MSAYKLYGGRFTRGLITEMVFAELDMKFDLVELNLMAGDHLGQAYLKINPTGKVPTLICPDGVVITEAPAINLFLCDHHRVGMLSPATGSATRGYFLSGLFFLAGELEPGMKRYFYPMRYCKHSADAAATKQQALKDVLGMLRTIDLKLGSLGPFYLGTDLSLVDITLAYWVKYISESEQLEELKSLNHCVELVVNRPRLEKSFNELEQMKKEYAAMQVSGGGVR